MPRLLPLLFAFVLAPPVHADSPGLPLLPGARFDPANVESSARFAAGVSPDAGRTLQTAALTADTLTIRGFIQPEAAHVGHAADLFIVARIAGQFMMRTPQGWRGWSGNVRDLQAWRSGVTLDAEMHVEVFSGRIAAPGTYVVFLGYRPADGVLRYTPAGQGLAIGALDSASWHHDDRGWNVNGTPPQCPSPLLVTPVDLARATSILYPGQTRGGDYKPHGGFRFDGAGQSNAEPVVAAMSGTVYRGVRYIQSGEVQYLFDIIHPCGVMLRYDHLRELSPAFAAIAATLPPPTADTFTTMLHGYSVSAGDVIGTAIGFDGNVGVDFGVYDLRRTNGVSPVRSGELAPYATCWFDALPAADAARVRALPAGDFASGSTSDYCR